MSVMSSNHAISGLMLSEAYGMTTGKTDQRMRSVISAALQFALQKQPQPKRHPDDQGGWRYTRMWQESDSDVSVTSWYLMFLRSCRNAGFDVPSQTVDEALAFMKRSFDPDKHIFWYALCGKRQRLFHRDGRLGPEPALPTAADLPAMMPGAVRTPFTPWCGVFTSACLALAAPGGPPYLPGLPRHSHSVE